jgi:Tfp pilus assembly protein PilF
MDALWPDGFVEEANLTQHVYRVRRAFRECGVENVIETAPRRGYCFNPPARPMRPSSSRVRYAIAAIAALVLLLLNSAAAQITQRGLDGEALRAYTLGRYFWNLGSMNGMRRSVRFFKTVASLAPHSALGYAALADAYTELADFAQPCGECGAWRVAAERNAAFALAADSSSAEAHVAYAMVRRVFYGDDATAAREFRTALSLEPSNALANHWFGNMLIAQGYAPEGVRRLELAAKQQPISTATYAWLARGYYYQRRYARAEYYAREALAFEPTRVETLVTLAFIEEGRGRYGDALATIATAERNGISHSDGQALRAGVYAAMGRRSRAVALLQRVAASGKLDVFAARDVVIGLAEAGDTQRARRRLAQLRFPTTLARELTMQDPRIKLLARN